jgi:phosphoenolpyruvate carboxykinase (ATP)
MDIGRFNPQKSIESQGITGVRNTHYNLLEPALIQAALVRGEGELGQGGTLLVTTGKYSGRSPKDKFTVAEPSVKDSIWWENNPPMEPTAFEVLRKDMFAYLADRDVFVQDLYAGADPEFRINVRQIHELAWHNLFIRHMLRRPKVEELSDFVPEFTVVNCPGFAADPTKHGCRSSTVIAVSFEQRLVLIGGTGYGGENKKSIFSILNYLLPEKGVVPMHCSANHAVADPDDVAIFFGLSGTGKTTLSADPNRVLLGDDEHGWSENSTFNFEGGCYAKTVHLSKEAEPEIYATTSKFGTVIENMVHDPYTMKLDFEDDSVTSNMRCAYPLGVISNASKSGIGGFPKTSLCSHVMPTECCRQSPGSRRRKLCTTSYLALPQKSLGPSWVSQSPNQPFPPVLVPLYAAPPRSIWQSLT